MFSLAEYRRRSQSLADFLPWAALIAPGIVLNKDGSLQRTARFRGPDLDSATPAELIGTAGRLNNALRRLLPQRLAKADIMMRSACLPARFMKMRSCDVRMSVRRKLSRTSRLPPIPATLTPCARTCGCAANGTNWAANRPKNS
jgi:hypothetical protein